MITNESDLRLNGVGQEVKVTMDVEVALVHELWDKHASMVVDLSDPACCQCTEVTIGTSRETQLVIVAQMGICAATTHPMKNLTTRVALGIEVYCRHAGGLGPVGAG